MFSRSFIIKISVFVFGAIAFFVPQETQALMYQLDNTTGSFFPNINNSVPGIQYATTASADPESTHAQVYSVILRVYNDKSTNGCVGEAGVTNGTISNGTTGATQLTMDGQTWYDHEFVFNTSTGVIYADEITKLYFSRNSGCLTSQFSPKVATGPVGSYPYASTCHNASGTCTVSTTEEMFFILKTVDDQAISNTNFISFASNFNVPQCGDFQNWEFTMDFSPEVEEAIYQGDDYSICVSYDQAPSEVSTSDSVWDCSKAQNTWQRKQTIPKFIPLNTSVPYWTQAHLCEGTVLSGSEFSPLEDVAPCDTILASSELEILVFNPAPECVGNVNMTPSATTTSYGDLTATCDNEDSIFRKVLCELFVPDAQAIKQFSTLKDVIDSKPPFGYFSVYSGAIENLSSATSTTSSIQTVDSSVSEGIALFAELDILETLRTFLAWFLWIVFVFYIYHRFKNFSMQG